VTITNSEFFDFSCQRISRANTTALTARFCYNFPVKSRKKKKQPERPIFDAIRKPIAPASRKIGHAKPEEKIHPAGRKSKHKAEPKVEE